MKGLIKKRYGTDNLNKYRNAVIETRYGYIVIELRDDNMCGIMNENGKGRIVKALDMERQVKEYIRTIQEKIRYINYGELG